MSESEGDENVHTTIILPNADITCNNQELFDSIRNDDIEKFQDLTSQFDNLNSVVLNLQGSDVPWMLRHQPLLPFVVAYFGASECFSYLLLLDKIDFDIVDNFGRHLYQFVVAGGSLEILRALDEKGIKLNMIADKNGNNIVHYAAKFGHFDVLKWLYVHGCKCFTDRNINGATPLMWACSGGNPEMINFLLQQGAKVNEHTLVNWCPLQYAAASNKVEAIKILLKQPDVEIDSLRKTSSRTPLMTAIEKNSVDAVKILTENGASFVDGKLKNNFLKINPHPIVYAVQNDRVEIVKYFLTRFDDALKDFTCYDMNSALENAQYNQNIEMVETLCVFIKDNYQKFAPKSPIEYFINQAILRNYPVEILNSLFGIGVVDYSYQNERDGLTLLHSAVKSKNLEAVKYLIEKGANPNMKDSSNDTPLSMAIKKKQSEIAELLANDSNLDVNMKIGRSNYLKMAQAKKFDNLVSILKGKGAIE